jgi:hypothetical protein
MVLLVYAAEWEWEARASGKDVRWFRCQTISATMGRSLNLSMQIGADFIAFVPEFTVCSFRHCENISTFYLS